MLIPNGISLVIKPGTKVVFASKRGLNLEVYGKLKAIENSEEVIQFKGNDWGSIIFKGDADDTLKFVKIEYATIGIICDNASPYISNCGISHCAGLSIDGGPTPGEPGIGISCINNSHPVIVNNRITDCRGGTGYWAAPGIGINCDFSSPYIKGNIIDRIYGGNSFGPPPGGDAIGINCNSSSPEIKNNDIKNLHPGFASKADWFERDAIGIQCVGTSKPTITENIIDMGELDYWRYAIVCENNSKPLIGGSPNDQNNFLRNPPIYPDEPGVWPFVINYTPNDIIATWNWWGVADPDTISLMIVDHNDDPQYGYVIFEPFIPDTTKKDTTEPDTILPDTSKPLPDSFAFYSLSPNPFMRVCKISYSLPEPASVSIEIFDITGRKIWSLFEPNLEEGDHQTLWDGMGRIRKNASFLKVYIL